MKNFYASIAAFVLSAMLGGASAHADAIPYPNAGVPNPVTYTFTASATGDVVAFFAGSGASFDNQLGMLDNGVLTGAGFGLDNHTSAIGQSFDLGHVTAGDTLIFVMHNLSLGKDAFSDPSLNVPYDLDGSVGHNHIYSTPYTATAPIIDGIPAGTYVGFEDLPFPGSDFNYFDETYVFNNVAVTSSVPEPTTLAIFGAALAGLGIVRRRKRSA